MGNLHLVSARTDDSKLPDLPESVQVGLADLAESAHEGLMAFSVELGLKALWEIMQWEVTELAGPRGKRDPDRTATRHASEDGEVVMGGRKVKTKRPRVRTPDMKQEVPLDSYQLFKDTDVIGQTMMERMLAGVSSRRQRRAAEPVGEKVGQTERSTSKSAIARQVKERLKEALEELIGRRLDALDLVAMMIDGVEIAGRVNAVAMGITVSGKKLPLGLWEGSTENAAVVTALLSDLQQRGFDATRPLLFVLDGSKALAKAVRDFFGAEVAIQRCHRHKERNILEHLPERERAATRLRLRSAWADPDHDKALEALKRLEGQLADVYPDAGASLGEGMADTLTVTRLGVTGALHKTLASTNPIESMIDTVRDVGRHVKRWRAGDMRKRWTAAGMLEAEQRFRRVIGYRDLPRLQLALERERDYLPKEGSMLKAA